MTTPDLAAQFTGNTTIPFERIAKFVRQVTHDVRNGLNAMDLQAAYLAEVVTEPDTAEEVKRLREQIQQSAKSLQHLSANFWLSPPSFIEYSAPIFVEDFRERLAKLCPDGNARLEWTVELPEQNIKIDIEQIFAALAELCKNAHQFADPKQKIAVRAFAEGGQFVIEWQQPLPAPVTDAENFGQEPFVSTRRGGYGLGLFRARMIVAAHGGEIHFSSESEAKSLTTRFSLPFAE